MTNFTRMDENGRIAARALIAMFVLALIAALTLPDVRLGSEAYAQASPSPTASRIQFVSPSGTTTGPGSELSSKSDGVDTLYHLVAWVDRLPSSPTVEFKYQVSGENVERNLGQATFVSPDTFELKWDMVTGPGGNIPEGAGTLRAILYSGTTEQSRDEHSVTVNNQPRPPNAAPNSTEEDQGETTEITYPTNGGGLGFFTPPGGRAQAVIDVSLSAGATKVDAYYTKSAPGVEPSWISCSGSSGETTAQAANGVRCTLAEGDTPAQVTAVAVAASDATAVGIPPGGERDSGDGHRVAPYVQTPTGVTLLPATQQVNANANGDFPCSGAITGSLTDQLGRKIAGANVDVHAAGPTDNLFFDDSGDNSSTHKAPDRAHTATEATVNCEDTAVPPGFNTGSGQTQGEHEVPGEGDIKHIESTTGTDDAGQFKFQLNNRGRLAGTTQITMWADRDEDDQQCGEEPQGDATIGWGQAPAATSGVPDDRATCPLPSPTGTSTSSPTASPTATPTRTSTGSPTASPSPGTSRTVTLVASDAKVEFGDEITLSGRIISSDSSCTDNEFVRILDRIHGTSGFNDRTSTTTDAQGSFSATIVVRSSADYQAVAPAHDNCQDASSDPATVLVKVKVSSTASKFRPERGETVRFVGKVTPNHRGTKAILQRKKGQRWVKVAVDQLNQRSRFRFVVDADWRRERVFRVLWRSQDDDHAAGRSRNMRIITQ